MIFSIEIESLPRILGPDRPKDLGQLGREFLGRDTQGHETRDVVELDIGRAQGSVDRCDLYEVFMNDAEAQSCRPKQIVESEVEWKGS